MNFPLIGNERLNKICSEYIKTNSLPHCIIIEGDAGSGRHTLCDYLIKSTLCCAPDKPCGICKDCSLIQAENHPDITYIVPEKDKINISVDVIRNAKGNAYSTPFRSKYRIFIIDVATYGLSEVCQNALLKLIEEPPEYLKIILVCNSKKDLLDTIISRCAVLTTIVPPFDMAYEYLCETEKKDRELIKEKLTAVLGSIGKAKSLLKKRNDHSVTEQANDFMKYVLEGKYYQMLHVCTPYFDNKRRNEALNFIFLIKSKIVDIIKVEKSIVLKKKLNYLFDLLCQCEEQINTNINLRLMWTRLVSCIDNGGN